MTIMGVPISAHVDIVFDESVLKPSYILSPSLIVFKNKS